MATEKRLIYLEDAIAKIVDTPSAIAERVFNGDYGYGQNPDVLVDRQHEVIELLMDAPDVEAAPVVHGRWEPRTDVFGFVRCSACHDCNIYDDWADGKKWSYCPNCGAKMDGDGNG